MSLDNVWIDMHKTQSGLDDEVVVDYCDYCDGEIYKGEEVFVTSDQAFLHEDCVRNYALWRLNAKTTYA